MSANLSRAAISIRHAQPDRDSSALLHLARACPQGDRLRFFYDRVDPWDRCRRFDEAEMLIAEMGEVLAGAAAYAIKNVWIVNDWRRVGYFFDRMVHPQQRRRGIARGLLRQQLDLCEDTELQYTLVLEDNHANRGLLESEGFIAHPQNLLYYSILPSLLAKRPAGPFYQWEENAGPVTELLTSRLTASHEFVDRAELSGHGIYQLGDREIEAACVVYRHAPKVFVTAPWYHRLLSKCFRFVPPMQTPIPSWALSHVWSASPRALTLLLQNIAWAAHEAGVRLVLVPLFDNDPLMEQVRPHTINRWGIAPARVCVYLRGQLTEDVMEMKKPPLASGRDG